MSTEEAIAGLRAWFGDALAHGNRALAGPRAQLRDERAHLQAPAEVIARWANTLLDLEHFANEDERVLRDLAASLARDSAVLRGSGEMQSRTRSERLTSIGTAWGAAGVAGAVDGLLDSQLPSILGAIGLYFGSQHADAERAPALLHAYRGVAAAALYTAARDLAAGTRHPPLPTEAAR
jgi:cell division protein FtsB